MPRRSLILLRAGAEDLQHPLATRGDAASRAAFSRIGFFSRGLS
jgi:hypothetical protein